MIYNHLLIPEWNDSVNGNTIKVQLFVSLGSGKYMDGMPPLGQGDGDAAQVVGKAP